MIVSTNHSFATIVFGLLATSAGLTQTCNQSIPLKTPDIEFTDHGDGTVTHLRTGLMWKICLEGQSAIDCTGVATSMTWSQGLALAESYEYAGYRNWRLPNIKELTSIVEYACDAPAINLSVFPNDPGSSLWSSGTFAGYPSLALVVSFIRGGNGRVTKDSSNYVRFVRDGQ